MNYARYLPAEIQTFVQETLAFYPADLDPLDWAAQRDVYDRMAAHFHRGRPAGLTVFDTTIGGLPVRVYGAPSQVTVLYAHGGGFVLGGLESHDDVCAELAARAGCRLVSIDYRLSPEHPHPAAYDDIAAVAEVLCRQGPVVLCGDSAGATLCAALSGTRADLGLRGQVLIYPMMGYEPEGGSFENHAEAPLLSLADIGLFADVRGGDAADPRLVPARGDFQNLPPTRLFPAECDPLCDDAVRYFAEASKAGVDARLLIHERLVHGWLRARDRNALARRSFDQIVEALVELTR